MQRYLEIRTTNNQVSTAAANVARHLLPRQHLGKTVVVCDKPVITISVLRKNWLKLSRNLQRERASTLNAEKILQLTYDITHMQHMNFVSKVPAECPYADVFFLTPDLADNIPANCRNVYILAPIAAGTVTSIVNQLPARSLIVDYTNSAEPSLLLRPKRELEDKLPAEWRKVEDFFVGYNLSIRDLTNNIYMTDHIDDAIDVILNTSNQFLQVSGTFLELLLLCQPMHISLAEQRMYDTLTILNRRISALTPGILHQQFAQPFGDDDLAFHDKVTDGLGASMALL